MCCGTRETRTRSRRFVRFPGWPPTPRTRWTSSTPTPRNEGSSKPSSPRPARWSGSPSATSSSVHGTTRWCSRCTGRACGCTRGSETWCCTRGTCCCSTRDPTFTGKPDTAAAGSRSCPSSRTPRHLGFVCSFPCWSSRWP